LEHHCGDDAVISQLTKQIRDRDARYRGLDLSPSELNDISLQMFRVDAIGFLVRGATAAFVENFDKIISGSFEIELLDTSTGRALWKCLKRFAKKYIYNDRSVLEVELKGHRTIHALMDIFWQAIVRREDSALLTSARAPFEQYVFSRISENYRRVATAESNMPMRYRELQLLTDMISGMTDTYAVELLADLEKHRG
jgi:dGTPase